MGAKLKRTRWTSCNVLQAGADFRHLWILGAGKHGFSLDSEQSLAPDAPLPARLIARDWKTLFQPRLNIALLPIDKVFLRVIQLPISEFGETVAMAELQLEKISPLPVTQIVWSIQVLPHTVDNLQTVIVIIAARDVVEEFLGRLEGQGFLADRLEVPILDQLLATPITGDGAWVYAGANPGRLTALVAWWYGGALRSLGLVHIPPAGNQDDILKEQLTQMAWAGELEGWLATEPHWYLVADDANSDLWQPLFHSWVGQLVEVIAPLSPPELAALTANRAARADTKANLLPVEYSTRYRQQFVDRLWMRGLGGFLAFYVAVVMIYFAALTFQTSKADGLERQAGSMRLAYTNVMKLKNQLQILQDREALKYASLDCWKAAAELLPAGFTVKTLDFKSGKFSLAGTAPADNGRQVEEFADLLRRAAVDGQPVFSKFERQVNRSTGNATEWRFAGDLARVEDMQ